MHKRFGDLEVLRGIDLAVAEHEVVCLIGASGSGKSTLLRCVNLLEPIDAGRIVVDGEEITARGVDVDRVRRRIGIVFQAFNLFPHMTVLRNVTLAPAQGARTPRAEAEARRRASCSTASGSPTRRDEYPDRLSGGQQQRVAIVRALAMQPRADAARRGDERARPGARRRGARTSSASSPTGGMTMLIATHEMGFAREIATASASSTAASILEEGPPERDLLARRASRGRSSSCSGSSPPGGSRR